MPARKISFSMGRFKLRKSPVANALIYTHSSIFNMYGHCRRLAPKYEAAVTTLKR